MDETSKRRWNFWYWLGVAFVLYALPAVVFGVDAEFFDGYLFTRLPDEMKATAHFVYWPVENFGKLWD